ncbi:MAG: hypothetical protein V1718_04500, partial [archaeon]
MKAEVSTWMWILGLTIMGMLIFAIGMSLGGNQMKNTNRQMAVQEYTEFLSKTKMVCKGGIHNSDALTSKFPDNIKAIYSSDIKGPPPDKVSSMIADGKRSFGKFLCIQFYNEGPQCEKLECNINMTYMGTPSLREDLFSRVN